jgi:chemotaxis protein methyltransferase CheR
MTNQALSVETPPFNKVKKTAKHKTEAITAFELTLLLQAIKFRYDYDFSNYSLGSLTRQINNCLNKYKLKNISELIPKILHEKGFFTLFLREISVTVTEMFRDPDVFNMIRDKVLSGLKKHSHINIWHAGCATGEEVYSLAIMLKEEGLLSRCQIYATDFNNHSINIAEQGIYKAEKIKGFTENYQLANGKASFADYYQAKHNYAKMSDSLKEHITFAHHDLIKGSAFAKMHLILCRNVLIYFNKNLQNHVLSLFQKSLHRGGYLVLGDKESLEFTDQKDNFLEIAKAQRIYQRIKQN